MNKFLNDKSRFTAILDLLSEKFVDDFVNYYLYNAYYPREFNETFDKYDEIKREILLEFSNTKIRTSHTELNKSFDALKVFLISHFYTPKEYYKMKNARYFYLEPRLHHNFRLSEGGKIGNEEKDSKEWDRYKNELHKYTESFEDAYKNFVKTAKKEIEKEKGSWIKQHTTEIIIGIIITVISGVILKVIL